MKLEQLLLQWFDENRLDHPWRVLWEKTKDPYVVWVSEVMLQQTTIAAVCPKYVAFMELFPDVTALAKADEDLFRAAVSGLGYYSRFTRLLAAAREWVAMGKKWPENAAEWRLVPGVGEYTAAALASITRGEAVAVVDGNVARVLCRLHDLRSSPAERSRALFLRSEAHRLVAQSRPGDFNQAIMELGQRICTKQGPDCENCPIAQFCLSKERGSQKLAPASQQRAEKKKVMVALTIEIDPTGKQCRVMERGVDSPFLKGTVGFSLKVVKNIDKGEDFAGSLRHVITHHQMTVAVYVVGQKSKSGLWIDCNEVYQRLMTSLDKKAWKIAMDFIPSFKLR